MEFTGKSFKNVKTGEIVKIIDAFHNIAITESKQKVDTRLLLDNTHYVEFVDPKSFFNNQTTYNAFAEKIKNLPLDKVPLDDQVRMGDDSAKFGSDDAAYTIVDNNDDEVEALKRKYGAIDPIKSVNKQNEIFSKIIEEESIQKIEVPRERTEIPTENGVQQAPIYNIIEQKNTQIEMKKDDPIISMFRNVKRNNEFNISFDIKYKIPRLDFIEMMEDSYETSIIEFLADEFTKDILKDPSSIKNKISEEIRRLVYGDKYQNPEPPKKATRKPRIKKESTTAND